MIHAVVFINQVWRFFVVVSAVIVVHGPVLEEWRVRHLSGVKKSRCSLCMKEESLLLEAATAETRQKWRSGDGRVSRRTSETLKGNEGPSLITQREAWSPLYQDFRPENRGKHLD